MFFSDRNKSSLVEIDEQWSFEQLWVAHEVLNELDRVERVQAKRAEKANK